jgi:dihydrodipicolinate synthase/N-acetylneuraminate lyase
MLLEGLHIPLTTPFHSDGRLNTPKLAANVARYCRTPAAGLIVLGPSAEPTLLSDDETREVLRAAAQSAAPEKVLTAGISRDSVAATLALAEHAASLDYDAVLVSPPSILAHDSDGRTQTMGRLRELITYFQVLADRSPLPIILCNAQSLTGQSRAIPTEAVVELAAHSRIIALVDAQSRARQSDAFEQLVLLTVGPRHDVAVTHHFAAVTKRMKKTAAHAHPSLVSAGSLTATPSAVAEPPPATLRTRTKSVGFQILAGDTEAMLDCLVAGAIGVAPAFAACAPQASYEVYAAWKDSDQPLAEEKQARLIEAAGLAEATPGTLKYVCDLNGYYGGPPRLPHLPPTGAQRSAIEHQMHPLRN